MSDSAYDRLVEELRLLPSNTVVAWGDDTCGDEGLLTPPLDVWAPDLARPLELHWIWTIVDEFDEGTGPLAVVVPAAEMTPQHLDEILTEWVAVHAGRTDIRFRYDSDLQSDLAGEHIRLSRIDPADQPPSNCAPDGTLHSLSSSNSPDGRPLTQCGRVIGEGWERHSGELLFTPEMTEEEDDAEWARGCC